MRPTSSSALALFFMYAQQTVDAFSMVQNTIRTKQTTTLEMALAVDEETNTLTVNPIKSLDGVVTLPGSKSLSNRCLLLAALSKGETRVENLLESDDIRYMLEALDQMKVPVARDPEDKTAVTVTGQAGPINAPSDEVCELFLGNAGTAMRPLAAALCMGEGKFVLDGVPRMRERPIADLIDGLKQLGADVSCVKETGCPPVTIDAKGLKGGKVSVHMKIILMAVKKRLSIMPFFIKLIMVTNLGFVQNFNVSTPGINQW